MMVAWGNIGKKVKDETHSQPAKCRCVCRCDRDAKFQVTTHKGILNLCPECFEERENPVWAP